MTPLRPQNVGPCYAALWNEYERTVEVKGGYMRTTNWREVNWSQLGQAWDILIVGGGITGAGILREASRLGFHCLLVEQHDFASGASSRSSKLVHGGLRYIKDGQFKLARDAVRQRERLLKEQTGLITPVGFLIPTYKGKRPGPWSYRLVLLLSGVVDSPRKSQHQHPQACLPPVP